MHTVSILCVQIPSLQSKILFSVNSWLNTWMLNPWIRRADYLLKKKSHIRRPSLSVQTYVVQGSTVFYICGTSEFGLATLLVLHVAFDYCVGQHRSRERKMSYRWLFWWILAVFLIYWDLLYCSCLIVVYWSKLS